MNLGMKLRFKPDRHGRFPIRLSLIPSSVSPGHRKPTGTVPLYHFPFRVRQIATTGPAPVPIFLLLIFPFTSPAPLSFHFSFFFYYFINSVRYQDSFSPFILFFFVSFFSIYFFFLQRIYPSCFYCSDRDSNSFHNLDSTRFKFACFRLDPAFISSYPSLRTRWDCRHL